MSCNLAIFRITDSEGFNVNLLDPSGFSVIDWLPAAPAFKDGGVWSGSSFVDGQLPVFGVYDNVTEDITLTLKAYSADAAAAKLQVLRRLLRQASVFFFGRVGPVVWLEARMHGETNTRYAVLTAGSLPLDGIVFGTPGVQMDSSVVMPDLKLSLTRLHWTSNLPGHGTAIEMSAISAYKGTVYGTVDEDGDRQPTSFYPIFVANKDNTVNLTNIHNGTGGANLLNATLPYTLFPGATTEVLFGIDISTTLGPSGPFSSLVFDIGTGGEGSRTITWEYLSAAGPTWSALTVDSALNFSNGGLLTDTIDSIHWTQPAFNTSTSPGGGLPFGYWVRARISAGDFTVEPTIQNRNPYTITNGYADIDIDQVDGDVPALAQLRIEATSQSEVSGVFTRVIGGIRTLSSLDSTFRAFLNDANEQNQGGVTGFGSDLVVRAASGKADSFTLAAGNDLGEHILSMTSMSEYTGTFRMLLRASSSLATADNATAPVSVSVVVGQVASGVVVNSIETRREPILYDEPYLVDLGLIDLPVGAGISNSYLTRSFNHTTTFGGNFTNSHATDTATIVVYELILIPVDEWSFEANSPVDAGPGSATLVIDGIESPTPRAVVLDIFDSGLTREIATWLLVTNGIPRLNSGRIQRLVLVTENRSGDTPTSPTELAVQVSYTINQQYFTLRGEE